MKIAVLALCLFATGCLASPQVAFVDTDPLGWPCGAGETVVWHNTDTVAARDMFLVFRLENNPAAGDLWFEVLTAAPDSTLFCDTVRLVSVPAERIGKYTEFEQPYRTGAVLAQPGDYRFTFTPLTQAPLRGFSAAGVRFQPR